MQEKDEQHEDYRATWQVDVKTPPATWPVGESPSEQRPEGACYPKDHYPNAHVLCSLVQGYNVDDDDDTALEKTCNAQAQRQHGQ